MTFFLRKSYNNYLLTQSIRIIKQLNGYQDILAARWNLAKLQLFSFLIKGITKFWINGLLKYGKKNWRDRYSFFQQKKASLSLLCKPNWMSVFPIQNAKAQCCSHRANGSKNPDALRIEDIIEISGTSRSNSVSEWMCQTQDAHIPSSCIRWR